MKNSYRPKPLKWQSDENGLVAYFCGTTFKVNKNESGTYNAVMYNHHSRPENDNNLPTIDDAKKACEKMLKLFLLNVFFERDDDDSMVITPHLMIPIMPFS